jgi:virginiamycin B lyase
LLSTAVSEFSGPFANPVDVATGADGNLWVLNNGYQGNSTLTVVGPDRSIKATYTIPTPNASATSLALGPDGNIWFVESQANKVGKVTPDGVFTEYDVPPVLVDLQMGTGPVAVAANPTAIIAGPDGALWFTESSSGGIGRVSTDGLVGSIPMPGRQPTSLAAGIDGLIWFTDTASAGAICRLNGDGTVTAFALPTPGAWPTGLIASPDGDGFRFVESLHGALGRVSYAGAVSEQPIGADLPSPQHLAFDGSGNLWVTGDGMGLVRVSPDGRTTDLGARPATSGTFGAITTGPDGALWFTDPSRSLLGRVNPADVPAASAPTPPQSPAPIVVPGDTGAGDPATTPTQTPPADPPPTPTPTPADLQRIAALIQAAMLKAWYLQTHRMIVQPLTFTRIAGTCGFTVTPRAW